MFHRLFSIASLLLFILPSSFGQFFEDFSDGEIENNPAWMGALDNFKVNADQQLQLDASMAGTSALFLPVDFSDTMVWEMDIKMDFAPSNDNKLDVYLQLDQIDPALANGYMFQIGETGSLDAIVFYRLDAGVKTELGKAMDGSMGSEPAQVKLRITKLDELFILESNYEQSDCLTEELIFSDEIYNADELAYFEFHCHYTSSRVDKFFFDNIRLGGIKNDTDGPSINDVQLLDPKTIQVICNEPISDLSAIATSNYLLNGSSFNVSSINLIGACQEIIQLNLDMNIASGISSILSVSNLEDLHGNIMIQTQDFELFLIEKPEDGDLAISEILFNPTTGGADYIELFNRSNKTLDLQGVEIHNLAKSDFKEISSQQILAPNAYIAFTSDPLSVIDQFDPPGNPDIIDQTLPSFNDDSGSFGLVYNNEIQEYFEYDEDIHFVLIDDNEGVSLERISYNIDSNDPNNWHSASTQINYGTPGYQNSQFNTEVVSDEAFSLINRIFSPDQDGYQDALFLHINLEEDGFLASIRIYDIQGYLIQELTNNALLAKENVIQWDGTDQNFNAAKLGTYVILAELFHPNGDKKRFKSTCVVAKNLN